MTWIEAAGHSGAFLSSITFIPQVYKAWQSKSVGDLSIAMMFIVFLSTIVWLIYGISLDLWPVIICNTIIAVLSLTLIYFKFTFNKK
jgi:MtN3 and saliva related transmembrane protein